MYEGRNTDCRPAGTLDRAGFMELAVARTDRAVLISDAAGRPCYVNPAFSRLFGYTLDDLAGQQAWSLLAGPETQERPYQRARKGRGTRGGFHDDLVLRNRSGEPVWIAARVEPVHDAGGELTYLVAMLADVAKPRRIQVLQRELLEALTRDMALSEFMALVCRQVEALAPHTTCSILRVDEHQRLRPLAAPSLPDRVARAIDGQQIGPRAGSCGTAAWRGEPVGSEDIEIDPLWASHKGLVLSLGYKACWSYPMVLRDGRVAGTFAFYFTECRGPDSWHIQLVEACLHLCVVAIERHETRTQIRRLAYYDALTGLPNRVLMRQRLEQTLADDPQRKKSIACLRIDLDRFKDINDAHGHLVGDALLEAASRRILARASTSDMACRTSGDGFALILDDCRADKAAKVAQTLVADLLVPFDIGGRSIPLSSSIGIALYPADAAEVDELITHSETAMVEAKSSGRGTYHFFSPAMNAQNRDRVELGAALREALAAGQLTLAYQPQIDRDKGGLYGVEALARWTHPELGPIGPDRFIAVAEQIGVIEPLGLWALGSACRQLAAWRSEGHAVPAISVNISAQQFRNGAFSAQVAEILAENGLKPRDLTIEITESVMLEQTPAVVSNTRALTAHGVNLSMDDFGTGYSSLSLIARLRVAELKIDRGFIDRLEQDASAQAVAAAVICIGQNLRMRVVAEGVETDAQRRFLDALGCDAQQGYLYSRPLSATEFSHWLDRSIDQLPQARIPQSG